MIRLFFFIVFCVLVTLLVVEFKPTFAHHINYGSFQSIPCSVLVSNPNVLPAVYYEGEPRSNPDGSFHPGDAVHFLFKLTHNTECITHDIGPLELTGDLIAYDVKMYGENKQHAVKTFEWIPKYLKTTHYYKKTITEVIHHGSKGGGNNWYEEIFTLSEKPILSIREDQTPTKSQLKKINKYKSHYLQDDIITKETFAWGLVREESIRTADLEYGHPLEDRHSQSILFEALDEYCLDLPWNEKCLYGHVELDTVFNSEVCLLDTLKKHHIQYTKEEIGEDYCVSNPDNFEITLKGTGRKCVSEDNGIVCKVVNKKHTGVFVPQVITPSQNILFEYPGLPDEDGYGSKNLDGTYYVDDSVGIQSVPDVPFKDVRYGAFSFENTIGSKNRPLIEIGKYHCHDSEQCVVDISGRRMSDFSHILGNGDLLYIVYGQDNNEFGIHTVEFFSDMYNFDRYVATYSGTAEVLLVDYLPSFGDVHPYLNWNSKGNSTLTKQHAIAVEYLGSFGGGTLGDDENLHSDRRAKINFFNYPIFGNSLDGSSFTGISSDDSVLALPMFEILNSSSTDDGTVHFENIRIRGEHIKTGQLINTTHIPKGGADLHDTIPHSSVLDVLGQSWESMMDGTSPAFESKTSDTGVFSQKGYARFYSDFDGLYAGASALRVFNVTAYGTLMTVDFAGYDILYPVHYQYLFPFALSDLNVTAIAVDEMQKTVESEKIKIDLVPVKLNGTVFIPDYYQKYGKRAGIDDPLVAMQIADFHDIANIITGNGTIHGIMNRSTIHVSERIQNFYGIDVDTHTGFSDNIRQSIEEKTQDVVLAGDDLYQYPEYVVLNTPGIYNMTITINDRTNIIEDFHMFHFNEKVDVVANVGENNTLFVGRQGELVTLFRTDKFGDFDTILVEDTLITDCLKGCSVLSNYNDTLRISATNIWGGLAHVTSIPITDLDLIPTTSQLETFLNSYGSYAMGTILFALFLFSLQRLLRKTWRK